MQKHIRKQFNLKEIFKLTDEQIILFAHFYSNKGRFFSIEKLLKKLKENGVDTKRLKGEKLESALAEREKELKPKILEAIPVLEAAGLIQKNDKTSDGVEEWKMPAYLISDLPGEQQILIGDKEHTSLTENSQQVVYKGDEVLYFFHPLSPQYKEGQRVGKGTVKSFHINEHGFVYVIIEEPKREDAKENAKNPMPAKRNSMIELISLDIPKGTSECVTYKKKAGLKKPVLNDLPDVSTGSHVILFNAEWSSKGLHMLQIMEGLIEAKELKGKFSFTAINTDHQIKECVDYNIRYAPTLIFIKDGKQEGRIDGFPSSENVNKEIYSVLKGLYNPSAKESVNFE